MLVEIDEELNRFGKFGLADLDNNKLKARDGPNEVDTQHTQLACEQQNSSRVSKPNESRRILPQWTRISRSNHGSASVQNEKITGKKRDSRNRGSFRVALASQNDDTIPFILVEAESQPRQISCLTWNYSELENLRIGRELVEIIRTKDPSIVFLVKTLTNEARLEVVQRNIDFDHR